MVSVAAENSAGLGRPRLSEAAVVASRKAGEHALNVARSVRSGQRALAAALTLSCRMNVSLCVIMCVPCSIRALLVTQQDWVNVLASERVHEQGLVLR